MCANTLYIKLLVYYILNNYIQFKCFLILLKFYLKINGSINQTFRRIFREPRPDNKIYTHNLSSLIKS